MMDRRPGSNHNPSNTVSVTLSDRQFRTMAAAMGPVIVYRERRILYVNRPAVVMLGAESESELAGQDLSAFVHPDTEISVIREFDEAGGPAAADFVRTETWVRRNGERFMVEASAGQVTYGGGPAVQLLCREVSGGAPFQLCDSLERYERMLQLSPEAVVLHANGVIFYANEAARKISGADYVEQLVGRSIFEFIDRENFPILKGRMASIDSSPEPLDYVVYKLIRMDGTVTEVEVTGVEFARLDGTIVIQSVLRELSERKKIEEAHRRNAEQYQRLIKFLPEPLVVTDNGIILYANKSAVRMVRAAGPDSVIGKSIFEFLHPDYHYDSMKVVRQVMSSDEPSSFVERQLVCDDGSIVQCELSSIRIHQYMGKPVLMTVMRDLTERKREEERLIKSEKLSVVGQLAAGVAHEIRNPLTALRGFTQLLIRDTGDRFAYLGTMLSELDRINYIVNEFMTLAKPHYVEYRPKRIRDIVFGVISILETQAILKSVRIDIDCPETLPRVHCDDNQLKQVFINLVKNALEAMDGPGVITIRARETDERDLQIVVSDNGPGIPEHMIRRLGEPFYTTKEQGTGLGLMICQKIIASHRGTFRIESVPGHGTSVEIVLPAGDGSPARHPEDE